MPRKGPGAGNATDAVGLAPKRSTTQYAPVGPLNRLVRGLGVRISPLGSVPLPDIARQIVAAGTIGAGEPTGGARRKQAHCCGVPHACLFVVSACPEKAELPVFSSPARAGGWAKVSISGRFWPSEACRAGKQRASGMKRAAATGESVGEVFEPSQQSS